MQRTAFANLSVGIAVSLLVNLTSVARTPDGDQDETPEIKAVIGAPFSAVGIRENVRVTSDGNRIVHKITTRPYRDGQGRTRLEREIITVINNKVTGEYDALFPKGKVASVAQRPYMKVVDTPATPPEITLAFGGKRIGPNDQGWSAPESLGEKSIDGIHVVGTQKVYTMAAGRIGNQDPITITVRQWSSPELGVIVDKTASSSIGMSSHYQLTQIVQAEPDPALFKVPADYRKILVKPRGGAETTASAH